MILFILKRPLFFHQNKWISTTNPLAKLRAETQEGSAAFGVLLPEMLLKPLIKACVHICGLGSLPGAHRCLPLTLAILTALQDH